MRKRLTDAMLQLVTTTLMLNRHRSRTPQSTLVLLLSFGVTLMHAPPFMVWHWIWLLGGSVALLVLLCVERATRSSIRDSH
jgi:hypothetical protein